ncbi:MAG TPA: tetratricopeptide repeat protein, partial [Planctomycetota bacterium]|nr:tetratricopeptide repeat protein [Planctomycetota bacterium]
MRRSRMTLWALLTAALLVLASVSRDAPAQRAMSHGQAEIQARKLWSLGDAVRRKGQYDKAVKAYEKSLEVLTTSGDDRSTLGMAAKQMIEFCNAMPIDVK